MPNSVKCFRVKHNKGQYCVAAELKIQVHCTVIFKSNMFSMIYNVWGWYDVKITQKYLLVLFLINIYSQNYNYTLKYSYGHYMVFVVSVTIFSVLQFLFCLQLFIFWLKADYNYSLYFTSSNMNISIFW